MPGSNKSPLSQKDIDAILFDFDGVLTNNLVYVAQNGTETVACNRSDGLAFDMMRDLKIPAYIISRETNPVVTARAKKLKIKAFHDVGDKAQIIRKLCQQENYKLDRLIFVGNDVNDLPALKIVGYPIAVQDAHPAVKNSAWRVLQQAGGGLVAREIIEDILNISAVSWIEKTLE